DFDYKLSVLKDGIPVFGVEVYSTLGWKKYSHEQFGLDTFGASAPYKDIYKEYGFTAEKVALKAKKTVDFWKDIKPILQERHRPEKKKSLDAKDKVDEPTEAKSTLPDGGLESWLQVLKAHLLITIAWGIVNSYGVFQTYYKSTLLKDSSASSISWIGTVQGFGIILISLFISPAYDRGYGRSLTIVGSILIIFGLLMTSTANKYYQVFIYQSVCIGIGSGCVFIPALGVIAKYFDKRISLAMGIAASGAGIGVWAWVQCIGLTRSRGAGFSSSFPKPDQPNWLCLDNAKIYKIPHQQSPPFNFSSLGEYTFVVFNISVFFIFIGIYFPYFYIPVYGKSIGSSSFSAYFISILNSASVFGRIIPSFIADQKGPLNMFIVSSVSLVALTYLWIGIRTMVGLVIFSVLYGFFAGAVMSLPTAVIAKLSSNLSYLGTQMAVSGRHPDSLQQRVFLGTDFFGNCDVGWCPGALSDQAEQVLPQLFPQDPGSFEFAFLPSALTCRVLSRQLAPAHASAYLAGAWLGLQNIVKCRTRVSRARPVSPQNTTRVPAACVRICPRMICAPWCTRDNGSPLGTRTRERCLEMSGSARRAGAQNRRFDADWGSTRIPRHASGSMRPGLCKRESARGTDPDGPRRSPAWRSGGSWSLLPGRHGAMAVHAASADSPAGQPCFACSTAAPLPGAAGHLLGLGVRLLGPGMHVGHTSGVRVGYTYWVCTSGCTLRVHIKHTKYTRIHVEHTLGIHANIRIGSAARVRGMHAAVFWSRPLLLSPAACALLHWGACRVFSSLSCPSRLFRLFSSVFSVLLCRPV
ncbi:hypothetical protein PMAC_003424, partial [Pneumocystis sp. 'macacae']